MKRMLFGFIVGMFVTPPFRQQPPTPETITITAKDCVDTITDFTVIHSWPTVFVPAGTFGVTDYFNRTIYLLDNFSLDLRRRTSIHELVHIKLATLGESQWTEEAVNKAELRLYKEIFSTDLR